MMKKMKTRLVSTTAAMVLLAGMAAASPVSDAILADLKAENATNVEIKIGAFQIKVEAFIGGAKVERVYDLSGTLLKEEVYENGVKAETGFEKFDEHGNVIKVEAGEDDDHRHRHDSDDHDDDDDDDDRRGRNRGHGGSGRG